MSESRGGNGNDGSTTDPEPTHLEDEPEIRDPRRTETAGQPEPGHLGAEPSDPSRLETRDQEPPSEEVRDPRREETKDDSARKQPRDPRRAEA